jgi:hypothetical protein
MNFYRGIIFAPPHAQLTVNHQKHMNVRLKYFPNIVDKPLLMIQDKKAYGIIKLTKIITITSVQQFKSLFPIHKISENERKNWWPHKSPSKKTPFYGYVIKLIKKLKKPVPVDWKQGPRIFIKPESLKFKK